MGPYFKREISLGLFVSEVPFEVSQSVHMGGSIYFRNLRVVYLT